MAKTKIALRFIPLRNKFSGHVLNIKDELITGLITEDFYVLIQGTQYMAFSLFSLEELIDNFYFPTDIPVRILDYVRGANVQLFTRVQFYEK